MSKRMMRKKEEECSLYLVICPPVTCQKAHEQTYDEKKGRRVQLVLGHLPSSDMSECT